MILTLLVLLLLTMEQGNAFDCEQAKTSVQPCTSFLVGGDAEPSASCCSGLNGLKSSTPTVEEQRAACECLKEFARSNPNIKDDLSLSLPKHCGVDVSFPISKNMNCNE